MDRLWGLRRGAQRIGPLRRQQRHLHHRGTSSSLTWIVLDVLKIRADDIFLISPFRLTMRKKWTCSNCSSIHSRRKDSKRWRRKPFQDCRNPSSAAICRLSIESGRAKSPAVNRRVISIATLKWSCGYEKTSDPAGFFNLTHCLNLFRRASTSSWGRHSPVSSPTFNSASIYPKMMRSRSTSSVLFIIFRKNCSSLKTFPFIIY